MRKIITCIFCLSFSCTSLFSQDTTKGKDVSINELINDKPAKEYVEASFKAPRVIMSHSTEMVKPGVLSFIIQHRFGNVNLGAYEFFGLDRATLRLGFDYGICNDLTIGIGRGDYKKEFDGFLKYRVIHQSTGPSSIPFSLIIVGGTTAQTLKPATGKIDFSNRLSYYGQIIAGRKFSEAFSLQIAPIIVHRNLTATNDDPNDTYAVEGGARFKLTRRVSFNIDYYYVVNKDKSQTTYNPLSIGFDLETGGHVFQLHLTNAIGMNERAFVTETTNNWGRGDIQIGFNISRAFQVKKKR
jgi:hypothetical protein